MLAALMLMPGVAAAAEPLFVPDFTPGTADEFAISVMVHGMVADRLLQDGHIVLGNEVVAPVAGSAAVTNCALTPTCPGDVLPKIPSHIAVVGRLTRVGETLIGHVELFEQSNPNPLQVVDLPLADGNEHMLAAEVSEAVAVMVQQVGPSPEEVLMAAARLISGQSPAATPEPAPISVTPIPVEPEPAVAETPAPIPDLDDPAPVPEPDVPMLRQKKGDGTEPHTGTLDSVLEGTGVSKRQLLGAEKHFMKSGLDPRDYMYKMMPHAGRVTFELRAGLGMGDVDRAANIRVETDNGDQSNAYYEEAPSGARNIRGSAYIGYAPATMVDLGLMVGLQYGQRFVTTGVTAVDANGEAADANVQGPTDLQAVTFLLQPRVRAYVVPLGPAKPFLFTGAEIRVFDRYQLEQPNDVSYPVPPGGVTPGWLGGGGMIIDPGPIVGFFAEVSYVRHFGLRAVASEFAQAEQWPHDYTPLELPGQSTIAISGGVQFRL